MRKAYPPMLGVHHCAICSADLETSLRFWRDGMGLTPFMDHTFTGDWPTLFNAKNDQLRSVFLGDPATPGAGIVELVVLEDLEAAPVRRDVPAVGFFLLSFERDVEPTLAQLASLGFADGVRRITMPAGPLTVEMAVVQAPDGITVELIGPPK